MSEPWPVAPAAPLVVTSSAKSAAPTQLGLTQASTIGVQPALAK